MHHFKHIDVKMLPCPFCGELPTYGNVYVGKTYVWLSCCDGSIEMKKYHDGTISDHIESEIEISNDWNNRYILNKLK